MTISFLVLFAVGIGMLVRRLMAVSNGRVASMLRSVPAWRERHRRTPVYDPGGVHFETFTISGSR